MRCPVARPLRHRLQPYACPWFYIPWIGCSPIGNHDGLPIGYQSREMHRSSIASTSHAYLNTRRSTLCERLACSPAANFSSNKVTAYLYRQAAFGCERFQRYGRTRSDVLNDFRRSKRPEARGGAVVFAARQAHQKTCGEEVPRAGYIHDLVDRLRSHRLDRVTRHHHATFFAARHHSKPGIVAQCFRRAGKVSGLVKAVQLTLVGENNIDGTFADQIEKFSPISVNAKGIG